MDFKQVIPFNPSKGGKVPYLCLDNVRRGYGINNKYPTAWVAWEHTQQHKNRNFPIGCDIPLYYSYTTTLDGLKDNYGHINVRLRDGTVWSDGKIYPNLDAYLANHSPKFVGWGESINDYKILEEEEVVDDAGARDILTNSMILTQPGSAPDRQPTAEEITDLVGKSYIQAMRDVRTWGPWGAAWNKVKHYDEDVKSAYKKGQAQEATVLPKGKYLFE